MRRWNGWGEEEIHVPLPPGAAEFLNQRVGPPLGPGLTVPLEDSVSRVPEPRLRLPSDARLDTTPEARLRHARGQSLSDWIELRSGTVTSYPDAVAYPETSEDVRALYALARATGAVLLPYGGGTSVVGHLTPPETDRPVLSVDLSRLSALTRFDEASRLATFGAGVAGPALEAQLAPLGYMLGHFPQSFEYATLGGWVVTRSSGQQSLGFGRIEDLFAGGTLESPAGAMYLPPLPASAAGPDLRHLVLGSEGRMGILSSVTVRVVPRFEKETFVAVFLPSFEEALAALSTIAQSGLPLSMARLSNPTETVTNLALAGHPRLIGNVERYLRFRSVSEGKCLLLLGSSRAGGTRALRDAIALAKDHGGVSLGSSLGKAWKKGRFRGPYLRNSLWDAGYAVDTLETATTWDNVPRLHDAIEKALRGALEPEGERVHVFTHVSHVYSSGSSLYSTYVYRLAADPALTLARWKKLKGAASAAIVAHGGTISHQHGVGKDHAPYLAAEKGPLGMSTLANAISHFDPEGLLASGNLMPPKEP